MWRTSTPRWTWRANCPPPIPPAFMKSVPSRCMCRSNAPTRPKTASRSIDALLLMTDMAWIHGALTAARPQAVGALLRYFRDMDRAEEAFQDACLRALKNWPENGPPRDPTAWLILVGRNAALDG